MSRTTSRPAPARALRRTTSLVTAASLAGGCLLVASSAAQADPANYNVVDRTQTTTAMVTADALPTTQINGVAWTQKIIGNTVYVGGEFSHARPAGAAAGTNETPRANLLAYDLTTGKLKTFAANTDGAVKVLAASPDGSRLYVGGSFTHIAGQAHSRLAAIDVATGQVVSGFNPTLDSTVQGIVVTDKAVYVGGAFSSANGSSRSKLAAFDPATGNLLGWAPRADNTVRTLTKSPDNSRIIAGGQFTNLNGSYNPGSGSLDATTGATQAWAFNKTVNNSGANAGIFSLTNDGTNVVATGFSYLQGKFEGASLIDPYTGAIKWMADCHGDSYSATVAGKVVYVASHEHNCDNMTSFPQFDGYKRATAFTYEDHSTVRTNSQAFYTNYAGLRAPAQVDWFPDFPAGTFTGQNQGTWSVDSNSQYTVWGGEFPSVNGVAQQGLSRFALPSIAPRRQGPRFGGADLKPTAQVKGTTVTLTWKTTVDRDNEELTYLVYRDDNPTTPVGQTKAKSLWWDRPSTSYVDTTMTPGRTYNYTVVAQDPDGNRISGTPLTVTAGQQTASSRYLAAVLPSNPVHLWRLGETSGNLMADSMGTNNMTNGIGVGRNQAGVLADDAASWFDGALGGWAFTASKEASSNNYSAELWFKSTTGAGGILMSQGDAQRYTSSVHDREIYLLNDGRLAYGLNSGGARRAVISTAKYNDGKWHHVVSTLSGAGMKLYADGVLVAQNAAYTSGSTMSGYWRLGGDSPSGLVSAPSATYVNATLDEVALYDKALDAATVRAHAQAGGITVG